MLGRLESIQTGCPFPLTVAYSVPVLPGYAPALEKAAHRQLAAYRREGEWFECDSAVAIAAVEEVAGHHRIIAHRAGAITWRLSRGSLPPAKTAGISYVRHLVEQDEFRAALSSGAAKHLCLGRVAARPQTARKTNVS